jgi:DNA-binding NtrC family response regulator
MILDDEPIVGKRLVPALAKMGCDIESFENPESALKRIEEKEFHIVVTDLRMENIDGLMVTGYATMEIARQALAKGAFDFIAKPFKPGDLRKIVFKAAQALGFHLKYEEEAA